MSPDHGASPGTATVVVLGAAAREKEVVVLTSYPEEMTIQYEEAFERAYPGTQVRIVW